MALFNAGTLRNVKIPKASEIIARKIKQDIINRVLEEGQLLPPEVKLMEEFGVSRPTIREAYRILESDRLVSVTRGAKGGAVIHRPTPTLITEHLLMVLGWERAYVSDLYNARLIIEPELASIVALKASKEAPKVLREIYERIVVLIDNTEDYAETLTEFHTHLVELAGNHMLIHMAAAIHEVISRHKVMVLSQIKREKSQTEFFEEAKIGLKSINKLIDFIAAGDADGAEDHWRKHIKKANARWLAQSDVLIKDLFHELK